MKLSEAYRERAVKIYGTEFKGKPHCVSKEKPVIERKKQEWLLSGRSLSFDEFLKTESRGD